MSEPDFFTVLRGRRSVRHFRDEPLGRADVDEVLQDAAWAPSGGNAQPWSVTALAPDAARSLLDQIEKRMWNALLPRVVTMRERAGMASTVNAARTSIESEVIVTGRPWILLVWSRHDPVDPALTRRVHEELVRGGASTPTWNEMERANGIVDLGVTHAGVAGFGYAVALAAQARGLGACIQHAWLAFESEILAQYAAPEHAQLASVILLGRPSSDVPRMPPRRPVVVSWR